jgi:diguanylate cyclase (GGDEF)-like protein
MGRGRRLPRERALFAVERAPRLVLRFAVVLSLSLALASAVILIVVRSFAVSQAEQAATRQAGLLTATLLRDEVREGDFTTVVPDSRRAELDAIFRAHLVTHETLGVSLVRDDGLVTYSTDHRFIGERDGDAGAAEAATGTIVSRTTTGSTAGAEDGTKVLETFTPVGPSRAPHGAAAIVQSYEPIERDAKRALFWVGGVLEGLLLVLFVIFVPLLARVTQRIRRQIEKIHFQALYDELTGLPNHAHLRERLDLAIARADSGGRRVACVLLDVDHFQEINDTLGHDAGDEVLRELGSRLRTLVDEDTLLSRPMSDQFVVVLEYETEEDVAALGSRLRAAVEEPLEVHGILLAVEGSVGIALHPQDGGDAESLLRHADVAVRAAKVRRLGVLAYSPADDPHDPAELGLVAELRGAAERGELVPRYQPKVDLARNVVTGFEALTYWEHPVHGLLSPGAFVPVAERTGAIRYLTRAVFDLAVRQLRDWQKHDGNLTIAVNLSAVDLLDLELADNLGAVLRLHGVDARNLCLEITESTIMGDVDRTHAVLDRLAGSGFRLSIDDFGTGYSSLAYLKNLPVHEVKIDRALVAGIVGSPQDRTIVRATVEMAHSLGLEVVAEGVETSSQESLLRSFHCDHAQGFLYSRPIPAEEVEATLADWVRAAA